MYSLFLPLTKKTVLKKIIISLVLCNLIGKGFGQEKETALDPVTVTGTLTEVNASKTGRNIFVLTGKDIAALPVRSIDELLRYIPGIEIQSRGAMGAQSDISMRGGTFQQVLVILDGLRLNDPNTGHFTGYIPVSPDEIDKIEVLKGPSAAIYGSDAVGGVINITTKAFAKNAKKQGGTAAQISAGDFGLINGSFQHLYAGKTTVFQIAGVTNNADGQQERGITGYIHDHLLSASASKQAGNWNLGWRSSYDDRRFAAQNFYTSFVFDTARERVKTFWNQVSLVYRKNKDQFSVNAGFKNTEDNYKFSSQSPANSSFSNLFQLDAVYQHTVSTQTSLTGGVNYISRNINSNDRGQHTVNQVAGFGIIQQSITPHLSVNGSLRFDWTEVSGWVVVPQINLSYRKNKIQLRASAGSTFRNPDFTELYNSYNQPLVTSGSIGNPNLSPEKTFNYEAGADWFVYKHAKISLGVFQRFCNGLIDWAATPYAEMPRQSNLVPTGNYLLAKNVSQVTTSGAELDMQVIQPLANKQSLSATAGLLWLDAVSNNGPLTLYVSSAAKFLANFSVKYQTPFYGISVNGIYKVRTPQTGTAVLAPVTGNYFVMNIKADVSIIRNILTAFAEADNLFNTSYTDFLGTPMPGRWLQGGLSVTLR